ncbi:hypothetical protein BOTBODRAFT_613327 [Botryobasidium botryosum FD-172 SS1]|uniref:Zn(2)-C6 fungal-type domain-containing protein n=1 Tax=Botryobasidium botryosum (strain FD-172 SS1) TaxID=930990 RepID=A0A067LY17_BOTB1|nr:hypothetical protein BOTBODRAFT_613327 [Botryobasidium botryosum FD-172 SS1]
MQSHNANLERGRACLLCRRRKQRCDAVKPVCGPCTRSKGPINCVYCPSRRELLEQRINELESHIDQIQLTHQDRTPKCSTSGHPTWSRSKSLRSHAPSSWGHVYKPGGTLELPLITSYVNQHNSLYPAFPRRLEKWGLGDIGEHKEIPSNIRTRLISLFIQFRGRHPFEFNVARLLYSLDLPPSHPDALHPVLVNAILLNGCLYAEDGFRQYEPLFANRIRRHLQQSLAYVEGLFDSVRALALFGCYLYSKNRVVEGHYYISSAMSLAITCGLNTIKSLDLDTQPMNNMLKPAKDLVELGDRINTFWMLFSMDRIGTLFDGGVSRGPADEEISTIWPSPSEYYEDNCVLLQEHGSVRSLYDLESQSMAYIGDNPIALRAKSYALLDRASKLFAQFK